MKDNKSKIDWNKFQKSYLKSYYWVKISDNLVALHDRYRTETRYNLESLNTVIFNIQKNKRSYRNFEAFEQDLKKYQEGLLYLNPPVYPKIVIKPETFWSKIKRWFVS